MSQLYLAARVGDIARVRERLRSGDDDVNWRDEDGETALYVASANGHVLVIEELLRAGAQVDLHDKARWTPLIRASMQGPNRRRAGAAAGWCARESCLWRQMDRSASGELAGPCRGGASAAGSWCRSCAARRRQQDGGLSGVPVDRRQVESCRYSGSAAPGLSGPLRLPSHITS